MEGRDVEATWFSKTPRFKSDECAKDFEKWWLLVRQGGISSSWPKNRRLHSEFVRS